MPLLVVTVNALSTSAAGLVLTPAGVAVAILSPVAGRFSDRVGVRWPIFLGLTLMGVSALFISSFAAGASPHLVALGSLGVGIGFAFINAPSTNTAAAALTREQLGTGMGIKGRYF